MSNFTPAGATSLLLKGLCSNFNADIYSRRRNILYIVYAAAVQCAAAGVCFIFARREYPLHTSSRSYPFITRPAQVQCARPRERELSVEIGGERWKLEHASASLNLHLKTLGALLVGVAPSCAGSRQKKCICIIFISILDLFILGIYGSFDCRLLPLVVGLLNSLSFQVRRSIVQASLQKKGAGCIIPHDDRA